MDALGGALVAPFCWPAERDKLATYRNPTSRDACGYARTANAFSSADALDYDKHSAALTHLSVQRLA